MRAAVFVISLSGAVFGQSIIETGAAAAGGSAAGASGKAVSEGLTSIFQKVDKQTAKAAAPVQDKDKPAIVTTGATIVRKPESVPPPPPPAHATAVVHKPAPLLPPPVVLDPVPPMPPPPEVTSSDLKTVIKPGMNRENLLALGAPASRVTMFDDGHLLEVYRYTEKQTTLGVVRLSDGQVSTVELR